MLDFLVISTRSGKRGIIEIYPKFIIKKSSDLMIRGGDFYAIWREDLGLWSTDEQDAVDLIDSELDRYAEENCKRFDENYRVMHMWDAETGMIDACVNGKIKYTNFRHQKDTNPRHKRGQIPPRSIPRKPGQPSGTMEYHTPRWRPERNEGVSRVQQDTAISFGGIQPAASGAATRD